MNWQDTVMGEKELQKGYCEGAYDVEYLIKRQAEISFEAGIRVVVEAVNTLTNVPACRYKNAYICLYKKMWQAKLKEWGIE